MSTKAVLAAVAVILSASGVLAAGSDPVGRMTPGDFEADWKSLIGEKVTLTGCHIEADQMIVVCTTETARILLDRVTMDRDDLRFTLRICKVGNDAQACIADVTGMADKLTDDMPELKRASFNKE